MNDVLVNVQSRVQGALNAIASHNLGIATTKLNEAIVLINAAKPTAAALLKECYDANGIPSAIVPPPAVP